MATVRKRGTGYRIRVYHGYDITGKQIERSRTWVPPVGMSDKQAQREAEIQAALFEDAIRNGDLGNGNIRFVDFSAEWLDNHARQHLKTKTVADYEQMLPRLNKAFGHMPINQIQPLTITKFYNTLKAQKPENMTYCAGGSVKEELKRAGLTQQKCADRGGIAVNAVWAACNGKNVSKRTAERISEIIGVPLSQLFEPTSAETLSASTVRHYHRLLSSILGMAVNWQFISFNPCSCVILPKDKQEKKLSYLDDEGAARLLTYLKEEKRVYRTAITLLLLTGIRKGELLGLEWKDVDWDNHTIEVRRAVQYTQKRGVYLDTPKNKTSKRVIYVGASVISLLEEHRQWQRQQKKLLKGKWVSTDRMIVQEDGQPMNPCTLSSWFGKFVKRRNLPEGLHLHSLRHTYATLCIAHGVPLTAVAAQLGHANVETTSRIYAHAIRKNQIEAATLIANAFSGVIAADG